MGFSYQKARYIVGLAQFIVGKQYNLVEIEAMDDQKAIDRLCSLKGVGRWTAEHFLLRGLGRTHIFPWTIPVRAIIYSAGWACLKP
jgi:DNA-3-methyladenine glycosylase II